LTTHPSSPKASEFVPSLLPFPACKPGTVVLPFGRATESFLSPHHVGTCSSFLSHGRRGPRRQNPISRPLSSLFSPLFFFRKVQYGKTFSPLFPRRKKLNGAVARSQTFPSPSFPPGSLVPRWPAEATGPLAAPLPEPESLSPLPLFSSSTNIIDQISFFLFVRSEGLRRQRTPKYTEEMFLFLFFPFGIRLVEPPPFFLSFPHGSWRDCSGLPLHIFTYDNRQTTSPFQNGMW